MTGARSRPSRSRPVDVVCAAQQIRLYDQSIRAARRAGEQARLDYLVNFVTQLESLISPTTSI
jgi:outer membrane protein TolC